MDIKGGRVRRVDSEMSNRKLRIGLSVRRDTNRRSKTAKNGSSTAKDWKSKVGDDGDVSFWAMTALLHLNPPEFGRKLLLMGYIDCIFTTQSGYIFRTNLTKQPVVVWSENMIGQCRVALAMGLLHPTLSADGE
ncbi:hypothetical protein V500_02520 [Pseudogymnoascus sp. VKM F-4518 (FW-2643)]|nr:hypothetical protein V500_02520 [Pseudogymnoascus sp. VKM F-4518 (FW-2643)]